MASQQKTTQFDLSTLSSLQQAQEEGIPISIIHPFDPDIEMGITITIAGPDSERRKIANRKSIDARLARKKIKIDAEGVEREMLRALVACVIAWDGVMDGGEVLTCTPENVANVFRKYPWIQEQVEAEASDRASFFKTSATSSATI